MAGHGSYKEETQINGKVVVITGANTGIGKETAISLAKRGGKIYIACRDKARGERAVEDIRKDSGSDKVYFLPLDLANLKSIRDFSQRFHQLETKLDILINNAGVMACPKMSTADGFEMQIGVNHLGHFLLTNLLLDLIKAASPSRIVNVSSRAHTRGQIYRDDFMLDKDYGSIKSYSQSKLANVLFTRKLAKILKDTGVTANSCHPGKIIICSWKTINCLNNFFKNLFTGVVNTELSRHLPKFVAILMKTIFSFIILTPVEGAQTQLRLALDPSLEKVSGKYFSNCVEEEPAKAAQDDDTAEWLWNKSKELVGI